MLSGDFYTTTSMQVGEETILATIQLNPAHRIFEGHFPGTPVVPGVCMMQMIKELLESALRVKCRLIHADHAKFLSVINPLEQACIQAAIQYKQEGGGVTSVKATFFNEQVTFLKYQARFKQLHPAT